ncbi:TPA: hypothetical protein DDZ86_00025 [Candidatus Dependentiae bacterium]|nr:MAG: hypothetical protein UW09_C0002G0113 [candidate division TM6 bacterium GW2011_GWF2_43_87]HBL98014.1 hypothetical protein [Candidatus Dependentiae bacterium]
MQHLSRSILCAFALLCGVLTARADNDIRIPLANEEIQEIVSSKQEFLFVGAELSPIMEAVSKVAALATTEDSTSSISEFQARMNHGCKTASKQLTANTIEEASRILNVRHNAVKNDDDVALLAGQLDKAREMIAQDALLIKVETSEELRAPRPPLEPGVTPNVGLPNPGPETTCGCDLPRDVNIINDLHVGGNATIEGSLIIVGPVIFHDDLILQPTAPDTSIALIYNDNAGNELARVYTPSAGPNGGIVISTDGGVTENFRVEETGGNVAITNSLLVGTTAGGLTVGSSTLAADNDLRVEGNAYVGATTGGMHVGGTTAPGDNNLIVDGTSLLVGNVTADADAYVGAISGGLHVGGISAPGDNNLLVDGTSTTVGNTYAGSTGLGGLTVGSTTAAGNTNLRVEGDAYVGATTGGLHVGGTSAPGDNNLLVDGTSTTVGNGYIGSTGLGGLTVGSTTAAGAQNLRVEGTTTLVGGITLVGDVTADANVYVGAVSGGLHVGGISAPGDNNLLVDGTSTTVGNTYAGSTGLGGLTVGSTTAAGNTNLRVEGTSVLLGDVTLSSNLNLAAATVVNKNAVLFIHDTGPIPVTNIFVGGAAGNLTLTGGENSGFGVGALAALINGTFNTGIGRRALQLVDTGIDNTALGALAGEFITSGSGNTVLGRDAGNALITGSDNTFLGRGAGSSISTSHNNIMIGSGNIGIFGEANTIRIGTGSTPSTSCYIGGVNVSDGANPLNLVGINPTNARLATSTTGGFTLTGDLGITGNLNLATATVVNKNSNRWIHSSGGSSNIFVGENAGTLTPGVGPNTALGAGSLGSIALGSGNTAVGYQALNASINGNNNTAIGDQALKLATGNENTAVGNVAGTAITNGTQNVLLGKGAGNALNTGSNNTFLGYGAGSAITTTNNNIVIGSGVAGVLGDATTTRIGAATQTACYIGGVDVSDGATALNIVGIDTNNKLATSTTGTFSLNGNMLIPGIDTLHTITLNTGGGNSGIIYANKFADIFGVSDFDRINLAFNYYDTTPSGVAPSSYTIPNAGYGTAQITLGPDGVTGGAITMGTSSANNAVPTARMTIRASGNVEIYNNLALGASSNRYAPAVPLAAASTPLIQYAVVDAAGAILRASNGVTCNHPSQGIYDFTFATAFSAAPIVVATAATGAYLACTTGSTTSTCQISVYNFPNTTIPLTGLADGACHIIAIGV